MKMLLTHALRAGVVACALCATVEVHAAELASQEELTLERAIALTVERNPLVRAMALESESLTGRAGVEALAPPWTLQTEFENFAGTGNVSSLSALEATVQLTRVIERGGKLALRKELGAREVDALAA
ncbi:MAG: hypothetical protein SXG53_28460, partial [Pseudomonadota bacterium]|nr:hypothetical protein [Pseudomonadota bacterium]